MSDAAASPADPGATIRSKSYRVLLVLAALIGVLVSFASWCYLELIHWIQQEVYQTLPSGLGLHPVPWWWPLPVLAAAGVLTAVAIIRLPGRGGHIPYEGIKAGAAKPASCRASCWPRWPPSASAWCWDEKPRSSPSAAAWRSWPCGW